MKTKHFFLMLAACFALTLHAQQTYRTFNGDIVISLTHHDSTVMLVSHKLLVNLDYETSKISLSVPLETFRTGIDSFDTRLKALKGIPIEFNGKIGIRVNPKDYSTQKYNMEGTITTANPPVTVRGYGNMTCMPAGDRLTPACTLLLSMETTLTVLGLNEIFSTANQDVRIDLRQTILEKVSP